MKCIPYKQVWDREMIYSYAYLRQVWPPVLWTVNNHCFTCLCLTLGSFQDVSSVTRKASLWLSMADWLIDWFTQSLTHSLDPRLVNHFSQLLIDFPVPIFRSSADALITETGETLHKSQQEKSALWIQSPEETSRVWIHGSRFPVPYYTQLKHTHTYVNTHLHTYIH